MITDSNRGGAGSIHDLVLWDLWWIKKISPSTSVVPVTYLSRQIGKILIPSLRIFVRLGIRVVLGLDTA
jgi:hypothetical protein